MSLPLSEVLAALERIAPLRLAEPWDNVGLLLEPATSAPLPIVLLTIDLDDSVLDEAQALGASLIVAYHPPIFEGLKRFRSSEPRERVISRCLRLGIGVFSPHTALDAAAGGVNDWLLEAFGPGTRAPCLPSAAEPEVGQGRSLVLATPLAFSDALARIKRHLGLAQLRVAAAPAHESGELAVRRVAVCAGAGGGLFEKLSGFDLYLTGELRHHTVLALRGARSSVVLCEHTHTERGFLPVLAERLSAETNAAVSFRVSACDRDPLRLL